MTSTGGKHMQAGRPGHRRPQYLWYLIFTVALILINVWMWAWIVIDAVNQEVLNQTSLVIVALASTVTLATVASLWRSPLSTNHRMLQTPALRYALATHHAGHIVAAYLFDLDRPRKTNISEPCNHHRPAVPIVTETEFRAEITVTLGGLVADEMFLGETGSHVAADLERATEIAAEMVGRFGMSDSAVSMRPGTRTRKAFVTRVIDDARTRKELETLMRRAKQDTLSLMIDNRHLIVALRDALVRTDKLTPSQIRAIIAHTNRHNRDDDEVLVDLRVVSGRPAIEAYR